MPVLDNILPAANGAAFDDGEKGALPGAPAKNSEPFDQVMTRALSSGESGPPAAQPQRAAAKIVSPQKKTFLNSIMPAAAFTENPPAITKDSNAPVKVQTGAKPEAIAAKDADLSAQNVTGTSPDASQNTPIFLLAPALAACFLKSFTPAATPKSAVNDPAVAAILPAGAEVKSGATPLAVVPSVDATVKTAVANAISQLAAGAAQNPVAAKNSDAGIPVAKKSDLKTADASVVVPKTLELTDVGDSAPKKVEALPTAAIATDDSPPKNSGGQADLQNSTLEVAAFAAVKPHGTSVAKQDVPMKNTEQTNKVAGSGEQVLPGAVISPARENNLPGRVATMPVSGRGAPAETNAATVSVSQDNPLRLTPTVENAAAASNFSEVRGSAVERTHDLMAANATRMVSANADSLQVVIKPDAGTQLSLELRQRGGGIEAQAVLQAGDFENLKQHWPELQQRLELRGIKLAPLTSDGGSASWSGNQGFKNQQPPPGERESFPPSVFAEFVPATEKNNLPEEPANQIAPSRGWQTWA